MFRRSEDKGRSAAQFRRGVRRTRRENLMVMRGGWRL